jgi:hypothetical protein
MHKQVLVRNANHRYPGPVNQIVQAAECIIKTDDQVGPDVLNGFVDLAETF